MKIVEDTETRMVVEDRPWGLGLILILFIVSTLYGAFDTTAEGRYGVTVLLLSISALIFWALNRYVALGRLVLDQSAGTATWHQITAARRVRESFALGDLRRAVVETRRDEGDTYRITLLFDSGRDPMPLTPYFSGMGRHEEIKARINAFLGAPDTANGD